MNVYICDIDGTLADNSHRSPYDENKVLEDKPLPTIEIIKALLATGDRIIYFSGRTKACELDTIKWIAKYIDPDGIEIYMREIGDNRSDDIVKREFYNKIYNQGLRPIGVFDDRLKVCRMWYELGIFVFNCNQGLKEF